MIAGKLKLAAGVLKDSIKSSPAAQLLASIKDRAY